MESLVSLLNVLACIAIALSLVALALFHFTKLEEMYQCQTTNDKSVCIQKHNRRNLICIFIIIGCAVLIVLT
jgi:putative copper export protein